MRLGGRMWRGAAFGLGLALMASATPGLALAGRIATPDRQEVVANDTTAPLFPSPTGLVFPGQVVATTSPAKTVTLQDMDSGPLTVQSVAISGADATDFAITNETCTGGPIASMATCTVAVTFTPGAVGSREALLQLFDATATELGVVGLSGTGQTFSSVSWGATHPAGSTRTWSYGSELARTTTASAAYLHAVYTTDRIGGKTVTDHGPYLGVYYIRSSSATGTTWSKRVRLNAATQHADHVVVAASGKHVYAAWISQKKAVHYSPSAARALYVRVNSHNGSGTWKGVKRLTSTAGRVGPADIAASGGHVYVAYTDSKTGKVYLQVSSNHGTTWHRTTIGTTTRTFGGDKSGIPSVAVSGSTVVVSWVANDAFVIKARISTTSGSTWQATLTMASGASGFPTTSALGNRIAVAWPTGDGADVRIRTAGAWSPVATVHPPVNGKTYADDYAVAVALNGTSGVGVAWTACWNDCVTGTDYRTDLVWAESATNGASWLATQAVGAATADATARINDAPAIVWPTTGRRTIVWNGWTGQSPNSRLYVRSGTGAP